MQRDNGHEVTVPPSYDAAIARPLEPTASSSDSGAGHAAFDHRWDGLSLPSGYFLLVNKANGRALDLLGHKTEGGSAIGLHPCKQPKCDADGGLQVSQNNQVLFVGWDGHLHFASASRTVDCVDDSLVLSVPRPVMAVPSRQSHPQPRFSLDPATSTLHVQYDVDPSFPGPYGDSQEWREVDYLVESVPRRRRQGEPSIWSTAPKDILTGLGSLGEAAPGYISNQLGNRLAGFNPFGAKQAASTSPSRDGVVSPTSSEAPPLPPKPVSPPLQPPSPRPTASTSAQPYRAAGDSPLPAIPQFEDPYSSDDSDSEPSGYRSVRVVRVGRSSWREKFPSEALTPQARSQYGLGRDSASEKELRRWRRRQWEVVPVVTRMKPVEPSSSLSIGLGLEQPRARQRNEYESEIPAARRWSATATSLASSVSQVGGLVVSSISGTLRAPLLSTVSSSSRRGSSATDGEDSLPITPGSRGSWDEALSLGDSDIAQYMADRAGRYSRSRSTSKSSARVLDDDTPLSSPSSELDQQLTIGSMAQSTASFADVMLPDLPLTPSREPVELAPAS